MYAIIDIETTGGKFNKEHIMEIAIFLFDGKTVVDQFITLVDPQAPIQPYVSKITGISEKTVRRAPKFYEIAKRVVKMTEDAVFVAHNVKFDYRVVQLEFERLGFDFHRKTLDTIDLTKVLIPGLKSYGLETVCDELGISNTNRHRADGDARATVELFKILLEKDTNKRITKMASTVEESEQQHPFRELVRPLQNAIGVFYLYNANGDVIYIGNGRDLRNSIDRIFLATNQQALAIQNETASINIEETGHEAIAIIKSFAEKRRLKPPYNKQNPFKALSVGLFSESEHGKIHFFRVGGTRQKKALAYFKTKEEAYDFLLDILVKNKLDAQNMLLEKDLHVLEPFLKKYQYKPEKSVLAPEDLRLHLFEKGNMQLIGAGRHPNEKCLIVIEKGMVKGYAYYTLDSFLENKEQIKKHLTNLKPHPFMDWVVNYFLEMEQLHASVH